MRDNANPRKNTGEEMLPNHTLLQQPCWVALLYARGSVVKGSAPGPPSFVLADARPACRSQCRLR